MKKIIYLVGVCLLFACDDDGGTQEPAVAGTQGATEAGTQGATESGTQGATESGTQGATEAGTQGATEAGTQGATEAGTQTNVCMPSVEAWDTQKAMIESKCGLCHGETPTYGSPYTLLDREALFEGEEGARKIDRMLARLTEGTMPPVGQPQLTQAEMVSFFEWASCGTIDPPAMVGGYEVTRPIYQTPAELPTDAQVLEWKVNGGIDGDNHDLYRCFAFHGPGGENEVQIVRFEALLDQAQVVHHIVVYESDNMLEDGVETSCGAGLNTAVFAWAPGQGALGFDRAGLLTSGRKRYVIEMHYNKAAEAPAVEDHSGIRVHYVPSAEIKLDMMTIGPENFYLPAGERTTVAGTCKIQEPLEIIATMPHMHEIGQRLESKIIRADGSIEDLITLDDWDFNFQLYYATEGLKLYPGDEIQTYCTFNNDTDRAVNFGPFTKDEMCFNFIYVTPPPTNRRCNEPLNENSNIDLGSCAPENGLSIAENIRGSYMEGIPAPATGGDLPVGLLKLVNSEVWFESFNLGPVTLDPAQSFYEGAGAVEIALNDTQFSLKLGVQGVANLISTRGASFTRPIQLSFGGNLNQLDQMMGSFSLDITCPETTQRNMTYSYTNDILALYFPFSEPVTGVQILYFQLAPNN